MLTITLLDVFLTVLYARAGSGLLAPRLARGVWRVFRGLSGGRRAGILNYCGPVQLVTLVLIWGVLLALGSGLIIHPVLGTSVKSSSGETGADFVTAYYAPPRILLVILDAAALIRTALDPRELGWLQESAALAELEGGSTLLLRTLNQSFPVHADPSADGLRSRERWRMRYGQALQRLREAGIPTRDDSDAGAQEYVELRAKWEPGIEALAPALGFRMEDVDRAGSSRLLRLAEG